MAEAFWTGVAMELGDYDLDWKFDSGTREAQITSIDFQLEDSTEDGVRVGIGILIALGMTVLQVAAGQTAIGA